MRVSAIFSQGGDHNGHDHFDHGCGYGYDGYNHRGCYYYNGYNDRHDRDFFYRSGDSGGLLSGLLG
jgi:hypothetical protein